MGGNVRRFAVIYDIHGNLPALEAVLGDIRSAEIDEIIVRGDVVPGPMPRETLECLLALDIAARFIMGNGDRIVLAQMDGVEPEEIPLSFRENIRWNASQLGPELKARMSTWPATLHIEIDSVGKVGSTRVINAGSVGMPFGEAGAYWLEMGDAIRLRHTMYDLAKAADRIRATAYPRAHDFAARNVLRPPSEEEILNSYASAELK